MTPKSIRNIGRNTNHIPTNLPPPYTWTGAQSGQLRARPSDLTTTSTLLIGPKATPFLIHTSLLTSQSPYFRAALTGPFSEATTNTVRLDDVDVSQCQLLVSWLYTGSVPPPYKDGKPAYYTLLHIYALADRLCFEGLRNAIVDLMADLADRTNSVLTPSDTRILYDQIRDSAPLQGLVVDLFAFKKTDRLLETHGDFWHAAFLRDLSVQLKRPCEQALLRHRLRMWCPDSWHNVRACDNCKTVLPPRYGAVVCDDCCVTFCTKCVEGGTGMAGWDDGRGKCEVLDEPAVDATGGGAGEGKERRLKKWESCKPWRGARCMLYHEHEETERCGDVFLGT
ncbi:hypothetical protein EK21DRAFT_77364 [Setomelanomma holmii]|uniref:BTB domain-containing protein n=1 Tax=Setomelanomma holmii TaxID=210430 RepID=A0A9P4LHB8_9PLEO|nr:hypothetical protein EK21DRAFT_77364 [Setomelanomma holmii]